MPKDKKSLFEIILVPALAAFFMGLVPIVLLVINNWATNKKDSEGGKETPRSEKSSKSDTDKVAQIKEDKKDKKEPPPRVEPSSDSSRDGLKTKPPPAFQPRSGPKDVLKVSHGKVEVTATLVEENRVLIAIVGREFGNDFSPLQKWMGETGELFKRKLEELALGSGSWNLTSKANTFTIRDGVASLDLTFERK
jgi:hypothetical protein